MHDPYFLKPCPFCGGKARHVANGGDHWVACKQCAATTAESKLGDAIALWNGRASDHPAAPEMLALLVDILKPGSVNGGVIEQGRDLLARLGHDVRSKTERRT